MFNDVFVQPRNRMDYLTRRKPIFKYCLLFAIQFLLLYFKKTCTMRSDVGSGSLIQIEMPLELEIAMSSFKKAKKYILDNNPTYLLSISAMAETWTAANKRITIMPSLGSILELNRRRKNRLRKIIPSMFVKQSSSVNCFSILISRV